jgi:glucokinase
VAGPVVQGSVETTNLPWEITTEDLRKASGIPWVRLINDLEAAGYGIAELDPGDQIPLNKAKGVEGATRVLIAAGTGLGEGLLVYQGDGRYHPVPSEGGHCDFGPRNAKEVGLLEFLLRSLPHVSYERVLSGPGLLNIYRYLRHSGRSETPEVSERIASAHDPSALVSEMALSDRSETCREALEMLVSIYGAEAGNLALTAKALGGVYVGGGIAPKIRPMICGGVFMRSFQDKGRLGSLLESIPVTLVVNSRMALLGAASCAAMHES